VDLDLLAPDQLVDLFLEEDAGVVPAVATARREVAQAIEIIESAFRLGGRLFYAGAGTSGRLGVLDASECPPTFGTDPEMVQGLIAGGDTALRNAVEGAEDDHQAGAAALAERNLDDRDVVVGIAASGSTPYVAGALRHAREVGAATALITCSRPPETTARLADVLIHMPVGPELVTGSTRLKSGTATKLVLNMLTTGAMVRLGKTYGNLMVDLQARNAKLHERGERIVMEVLGVDRATARSAINAAGGSVRTAIAMLHLEVDVDTARSRLDAAGGRLRELLGPPPRISDR